MEKMHEVQEVFVDGAILRMQVDGVSWSFDLSRHSKRLAKATQAQRANLVVSSNGYGIHWPDVDEDLSINGMIRDSTS